MDKHGLGPGHNGRDDNSDSIENISMTLSMRLRALLNEYTYELYNKPYIDHFMILDSYMPKITAAIKQHIKDTKPVTSYTDAQVELNKWEKKLLEELI